MQQVQQWCVNDDVIFTGSSSDGTSNVARDDGTRNVTAETTATASPTAQATTATAK